jgi:hypothetical protein
MLSKSLEDCDFGIVFGDVERMGVELERSMTVVGSEKRGVGKA